MNTNRNVEEYESKEKDVNWNLLYLIVFLVLVLQIIFYYFITKHFQ
jgi:hypothetical protein